MKLQLLACLSVLAVGCAPDAAGQRYRGGYTLGHEVNTFCPGSGAQCYWLAPGTGAAVRDQLGSLYEQNTPGLYQPVCMVVAAEIDRESERTGFAVDTDGLITIKRVYGLCDSGNE